MVSKKNQNCDKIPRLQMPDRSVKTVHPGKPDLGNDKIGARGKTNLWRSEGFKILKTWKAQRQGGLEGMCRISWTKILS